jgi:hypothetical protein
LFSDSNYNKFVYDGGSVTVGITGISGYYPRGLTSFDGNVMYSLDSRTSPNESTLRKCNSSGGLIQQTNPILNYYDFVLQPIALRDSMLFISSQQSPPNNNYSIQAFNYNTLALTTINTFTVTLSGVSVYVLKALNYTV